MIIGRGSIASVIQDRDGFVFFATGESNRIPLTAERAKNEFRKIATEALTIEPTEMFVYVSGLNIYYQEGDGRSDYTAHKLKMEQFVRDYFENYAIIRLGSITWGDNPNTLVNYLREQISANPNFEGRPVHRYLHTKAELTHWFNMIPKSGKHEMNITGQIVWVPDLVERLKKGEI